MLFQLGTPCSVHRVDTKYLSPKPPALLSRGLRLHGKIRSCYTLGLYLRTQMIVNFFSGPLDDEPLLTLTGAMSRCSREKVLMCTVVHIRGNWSPLSKYRGFSVYSMNKLGGRRKMFITKANSAT